MRISRLRSSVIACGRTDITAIQASSVVRSFSIARPTTIIGVMPLGFEFPLGRGTLHPIQLWVPLSFIPSKSRIMRREIFATRWLRGLENGVSLRQAAEDADRVSRQIMANYPARWRPYIFAAT